LPQHFKRGGITDSRGLNLRHSWKALSVIHGGEPTASKLRNDDLVGDCLPPILGGISDGLLRFPRTINPSCGIYEEPNPLDELHLYDTSLPVKMRCSAPARLS
jgi:hypothetical protein